MSSARVIGLQIFAGSFVVLFQELALIRWLPVQVRAVAYFPNVVLISAFLGLGVGALMARRRSLLWFWPASLLILVGAAAWASTVAFTHEQPNEWLWLLYFDLPSGAPKVRGLRVPIVFAFVLTAMTFVPLGQFVSHRIARFRELGGSLWGYSWDLLGSLIGVIAFAVASFQRSFPVAWFAILLAAGVALFWHSRRLLPYYAGLAACVLLIVGLRERAQYYSPYYGLRTTAEPDRTFVVTTNGSLHQRALALADSTAITTDWMRPIPRGYHLPYRLLARKPRNVLVLGAGTGNDVSVALSEGAQQVHAVEIDPVILELGDAHPDAPYASPRVTRVNGDARAYLNDTKELYDLIVFGTLDSMTRLSALSNVRLDNFVYTAECIAAARKRLTADGGLVMYFYVGMPFIDDHLQALLTQAFAQPPTVVDQDFVMFNRVYMAGEGFAHLRRDEQPRVAERVANGQAATIPTDDWPYLYLRGRSVSGFYLSLIAIIAVISALVIFGVSGSMRAALQGRGTVDVQMFLFGVAFLLLETKLVTQMNLVWGATWLTSAVVFGSVLAVLLAGTVLMQVRPLRWWPSALALIVALLATYLLPTGRLAAMDEGARLLWSVLFVGTPIFFASVCFALQFRERAEPDVAFGWNLLGAVAGGLLEFASMAIGLNNLTLVALGAYLLAFLVRPRQPAPAVAQNA